MPSWHRRLLPLLILTSLLGARRVQAAWGGASTGAMTSPRSDHTATLLLSGLVLVTGGRAGDDPLGTAELYEPATGIWSLTGSMSSPRYGHTATLLPSGLVLVMGGAANASSVLATAELYDPATGTWSPTGSMFTARKTPTATLLPSGQVLVAGGHDGEAPLATAELYDLASSSWTPTAPMAARRANHRAVLLASGKALVVGRSETPASSSAAELYDPLTRRWSNTPSMGWQRLMPGVTLLPSGRVLVMGGGPQGEFPFSGELYDPATDTWTPTGLPGLNGRTRHTATLLYSGQVLIAGGISEATLASAELSPSEGRTPPVARPLQVVMAEDTPKPVVMVGLDADGDALSYSVVAGPAYGTLSGTVPHLTYTPNPNFHGDDTFTYAVSDGTVGSSPVTVRLTVVPVNDAPQALSLSWVTFEAVPLPLPLPETDIDGDMLVYTVVTKPLYGKLLGRAPHLTYVPPSGGYGQDSFTYRVRDGTFESAVGTVSISVTPDPERQGCSTLAEAGASTCGAALLLLWPALRPRRRSPRGQDRS